MWGSVDQGRRGGANPRRSSDMPVGEELRGVQVKVRGLPDRRAGPAADD